MRLIVPSSPTLISTNVAASSLSEWSAATTYALGATVKLTAGQALPHHEFESLQADNINHQPAIGGNDWWLDLGATNQHKMFDLRNGSRSVATAVDGSIRVVIQPPARTAVLALLGIKGAKQAVITQRYGGAVKSSETVNLLTTDSPTGLWTYFFGEYRVTTSTVRELPGLWYQPEITIELIAEGGAPVECGECFLGQAFDIGDTEWGAQPGLLDYSTFEKDEFGETFFVPRLNVREGTYTIWAETAQFDRIFSLFETCINKLVLIDGNNVSTRYDALRVFGKITSVRAGLAYGQTPIDIQIEGIT